MAAFSTTPHGASQATGAGGPAVINVRRPRTIPGEAPIAAELVLAAVDETLPPTVLRLPNLAAIPGSASTLNKVLSILHWCFIGLGSLIALWLIFGGRGGPKPTGDELPAAPARAQVDTTPAWNPPPLDTAGNSDAPKWTPPAASAAPGANSMTPPNLELAPPAAPPVSAPATGETDMPSHETWPQGGSTEPAASPAGDAPNSETPPAAKEPELPAAPTWQDAGSPPVEATAGPVARTASRETAVADPAPGGEAHPLDLTVPVTQ